VGIVIRLVEDDFSLVECMEPTGGFCAITPSCQLKRALTEALAAYLAVLDQYTLADIARYKTVLRSLLAIDSDTAGGRRGRATPEVLS
jgi:Rrf2 family nitric oxide-sensitive transcriptional repressor